MSCARTISSAEVRRSSPRRILPLKFSSARNRSINATLRPLQPAAREVFREDLSGPNALRPSRNGFLAPAFGDSQDIDPRAAHGSSRTQLQDMLRKAKEPDIPERSLRPKLLS